MYQSKAVFIDKDGTLIPDIPYNVNADLTTLQQGAAEGLRLLQQQGFLLIVITNQSGVAHGYFPEDALQKVQKKIEGLLADKGVTLNGFYYCPHHLFGTVQQYAVRCHCRKPLPGLLLQAANDFNINLSDSWMLGDILNDVEAGHKAGCKTILIDNGGETEWVMTKERTPDFTVKNFLEAANVIIQYSKNLVNA